MEPAPKTEELATVWRALADPTRRAILDLLREGPRTTGDIVARFDLTRFGVMRHLEVLVDAGLVLVQREGRTRWNRLNPMPIHQIYRRWIQPFESTVADRLLRLKHHAESVMEDSMSAAPKFRTLDIQLEVEIARPPEVVWQSLTGRIGDWWPAQFYVGKTPRRFLLEERVGGRLFEDWGGDEGVLFGTVTTFERNSVLQWAGDMSADFGGPARSVTTFRLRPAAGGEGTLLAFRDTPFGLLSDGAVKELERGWKWLLEDCFKPYVEHGRQPERPATLEV